MIDAPEANLLLVEDEAPIREMLVFGLQRQGFEVQEAADARAARDQLASHPPDLILLDWMLPDQSGLELARGLRRDESFQDLPIIMLTARVEEADKVRGLNTVDDYVTKPFSTSELVARIRAVLRRSGTAGGTMLSVGNLRADLAAREVRADGKTLPLAPAEYRLLVFLMRHPDRVFSRRQLLDRVWGQDAWIEERTVDVHVRRLRRALFPFGAQDHLVTVRGSGYRLSAAT